jgi:8-oxo-dGTP pyrophosphatase MutT (NUDIX family)
LAATHTVMASGDASFSDDGEQAKAQTNPAENPHGDSSDLKPAAVLVLLINDVEPKILFTQRTAHLTDHAGQISFPGGRVEASDRDAVHTALRETMEETGVDSGAIEIIGTLPFYTTGTGYLITPVVGWIDGPLVYTPDPKEVAECFEVPFHFLIDPRNHRLETAMYKGRMRSYYAVPYDNRYIWGATAGMLVTLTRVVAHARGEPYQPAVEWKNDSGR